MKIDELSRYVMVGSKTGVVQVFNLHDFSAASDELTFSTFEITSIEAYSKLPDLHLVVAL